MKKIIYNILSLFFLFLLGACTELEGEYGYLYADVEKDTSEEIIFKSGASEEELVFALDIYDYFGTKKAHVDDYRTLAQEPLSLHVANYKVIAYSGTDGAAAFDQPFYSGSADVRINKDEMSNIEIPCSLANVKVTAKFSDEIKDLFTTYRLTVSNGEGTLIYDEESGTLDKEGYFRANGTLNWSLYLVNTDGTVYEALTDLYTDVKAKQHYNLSFSMAPPSENGAAAISIICDNSENSKTYDLVADFGDDTVPAISANFDMTQKMFLVAGEAVSAKLAITSPDGFARLSLSYEVPARQTAVVDLANASESTIQHLADLGIIAEAVSDAVTTTEIDFSTYLTNLNLGEYLLSFVAVDVNGRYDKRDIAVEIGSPVEAVAVSVDAWARHAVFEGRWFADEQPAGMGFQYKAASADEWTDFIGQISPNTSTRRFKAELGGLEPGTAYQFRAVTDKDKDTQVLDFTTETEQFVPNLNFDSWWQDNKVWYPNSSSSETIWDSANPAAANFVGSTTAPEEGVVAVSGSGKKAAKLQSDYAVIAFAAGNIYTGKFGKIDGVGAELDWGIPFTAHPLGLKGYFNYIPKAIDNVQAPYEHLKGTTDQCQIQILLTNWTKPFTINTKAGRFVDFNGPDIVAYGSFEYGANTNGYQPFEIKLDYRRPRSEATYIVIVGAASRYGDYFTGAKGTVLYLDEFELVYDPSEFTE